MEKYALVHVEHSYVVIPYNTWLERPNGCVMQTSYNKEDLENEADWRNNQEDFLQELREACFGDDFESL